MLSVDIFYDLSTAYLQTAEKSFKLTQKLFAFGWVNSPTRISIFEIQVNSCRFKNKCLRAVIYVIQSNLLSVFELQKSVFF